MVRPKSEPWCLHVGREARYRRLVDSDTPHDLPACNVVVGMSLDHIALVAVLG